MLGSSFMSIAQQLTSEIHYYSKEDGLSDHRILTVLEHSDGYVWVGTYNGLNRFDGYEFIPISLPKRKEATNGTMDPYIDELFELENGIIAIVYGDGSGVFNDIAILFNPKTHESEEVVLIDFSQQKMKGVLKIKNKAPLKYKILDTKRAENVTKKTDQFGNQVLYGIKQGEKYFQLVLKSGEKLNLSETYGSLFHPHFYGNDFSDLIFMTSLNGLVKVDVHRSPFKTYLNEEIEDWGYSLSGRAIADIGNDRILFSTEQEELIILEKTTNTLKSISLLEGTQERFSFPKGSKSIRSIYPENDSIVWLTGMVIPV